MSTDVGREPIGGQARFKRPYLKIGVVVVIAVSVIGLGYLGPRPPSQHSSPAASSAAEPLPSAEASLGPVAAASGPETLGIQALTRLATVEPQAGQMRFSQLSASITSRVPAILGLRLFYVADGNRIESTVIGTAGSTQTLVRLPPCRAVNQLAAAGHEIAYVVTMPVGAPADSTGCGTSSTVAWSVWLLDLDGGEPTEITFGSRAPTSIEVAEMPVHIALTDSAVAFDVPSAGGDSAEALEVLSLDGTALWRSNTQSPVQAVMLGGGRLAFLTSQVLPTPGRLNLWTSTATHPAPVLVAEAASAAALSSDGAFLTWDLPPAEAKPASILESAVAVETLDTGVVELVATPTGPAPAEPLQMAVTTTARGPLLSWFATAPGGSVYPAFRFAAALAGGVIGSFQQPVWLTVEAGTLVWIAENSDGSSVVAFAVDVSNLGPM